MLSPLKSWEVVGPFLLFLLLLTLLNAPFDWASLGLTRALLRRGLELGGWWPYVLALVDAALAGIIIAALLSCRWTPSWTGSPKIRRRRNIGGPRRSCSHL